MRKKIKDTILIEELNGEKIGTWINTLVQLRDDIGDLATISVCADDDQFFQKTEVSIYATFERIENNSEDLKIEKIKNFAADNGVTITSVNFL